MASAQFDQREASDQSGEGERTETEFEELYGDPQHDVASSSDDEPLYGDPQHDAGEIEDPELLYVLRWG